MATYLLTLVCIHYYDLMEAMGCRGIARFEQGGGGPVDQAKHTGRERS
jgi:hypothetical protein